MFIIVIIIITSSSNTSGPEWPPRKCTNTVLFSVHVPTEGGLGGQFVIPRFISVDSRWNPRDAAAPAH